MKDIGKGLGSFLLIDALRRCFEILTISIDCMVVITDPTDEKPIAFYLKYGFIKFPDSGKMFLLMRTEGLLFIDKVFFHKLPGVSIISAMQSYF